MSAMSVPPSMYALPAIVSHSTPLSLPSCMYKMNVMQGGTVEAEGAANGAQSSSPPTDVNAFERRQESLLDRLSQLKGAVDNLRGEMGIETATNKKRTAFSLVVRASPQAPPFALLCVINQLKKKSGVSVEVGTHIHSSLKEKVPKNLSDFLPHDNACAQSTGAKFKVRVTVIWADVGVDPECVIGLDRLIKGEVNILRYVARCLPDEFVYESGSAAIQIDQVLDLCHCCVAYGSEKDRQEALQFMDNLLKKQSSLTPPGAALGIADFAAWSALVNCGMADTKLSSVSKWSKAVSALAGHTGASRSHTGRKNSNHRIRRKTKSGGAGGGGPHSPVAVETGKESAKPTPSANPKKRNRRKSNSKSKSSSPAT